MLERDFQWCGRLRRWFRVSEACFQCSAVYTAAMQIDRVDTAQIADVFERVRIQQDEVGEASGTDRADFAGFAENFGGAARRRLKRASRRDPSLYHPLQL